MNLRSRTSAALLLAGLVAVSACAFNVVILQKTPAQLVATPPSEQGWSLTAETHATLAAGWASTLRPGTLWHRTGTIAEGDVLHTKDQLVTIEASNSYQADIVVRDGRLVGFFLPVDHVFTACSPPIAIALAEQAH
jgi:hypothetical protein